MREAKGPKAGCCFHQSHLIRSYFANGRRRRGPALDSTLCFDQPRRFQRPALKPGECQQTCAGETIAMNDPVEGGARVGGEVAFELDLSAHNTDLAAGLDDTAREGGGEVSQRKRLDRKSGAEGR